MTASKILAETISVDNKQLLEDKQCRKKAVVNSLILANLLIKNIKSCDNLSNVQIAATYHK